MVCYQGKCEDLCSLAKPCGRAADCEIIKHAAICSCDKSLTGDPYVACVDFENPQCENDLECLGDAGCFNGICKEMCDHMNVCGENAVCRVNRAGIRKSIYCECISGFTGDPYNYCSPDIFELPQCSNDEDCDLNFKCSDGKCIDLCEMNQICVSSGALCRTLRHRPMCYCPPGYVGDPVTKCVKSECSSDNNCKFDSICLSDRCVNTCSVNDKCATNAQCHSENHSSQCICLPGYTGDPYKKCEQLQCISDSDCSDSLTCTDNRCINPCKISSPCDSSRTCDVINHKIICTCENGFVLNNDNNCEPQPGKQLSTCIVDADCSNERACMLDQCMDMCSENPCGIDAICRMRHKNGEAMMICECSEDFIGNPFEECTAVSRIPSGCSSNTECPWSESCNRNRCVDPCSLDDVCGQGAMCHIRDHRAVCSCPLRHAGDPLLFCSPGKLPHLTTCITI